MRGLVLLCAVATAGAATLLFGSGDGTTSCKMQKAGQQINADCDVAFGSSSIKRNAEAIASLREFGTAQAQTNGEAIAALQAFATAQANENTALKAVLGEQATLISGLAAKLNALSGKHDAAHSDLVAADSSLEAADAKLASSIAAVRAMTPTPAPTPLCTHYQYEESGQCKACPGNEDGKNSLGCGDPTHTRCANEDGTYAGSTWCAACWHYEFATLGTGVKGNLCKPCPGNENGKNSLGCGDHSHTRCANVDGTYAGESWCANCWHYEHATLGNSVKGNACKPCPGNENNENKLGCEHYSHTRCKAGQDGTYAGSSWCAKCKSGVKCPTSPGTPYVAPFAITGALGYRDLYPAGKPAWGSDGSDGYYAFTSLPSGGEMAKTPVYYKVQMGGSTSPCLSEGGGSFTVNREATVTIACSNHQGHSRPVYFANPSGQPEVQLQTRLGNGKPLADVRSLGSPHRITHHSGHPLAFFQGTVPAGSHTVCCSGGWATGVFLQK